MGERKQIEIMDCTLRDGEQTNGVSFLPHEKLMIARALLSDVKVDRIEIASARVSEGEKDAVRMICRYAELNGILNKVEVLGFVDGNKENPLKYASLVRQAELSKSLSRFFKQAVNDLAYGETNNLPSEIRTLPVVWKSSSDENYAVHVIYSGGDDVFMVGAWNELLDLAIRMRKAFAYYTGGKITLSAGLALFTPKYPIDKMADITGALESIMEP